MQSFLSKPQCHAAEWNCTHRSPLNPCVPTLECPRCDAAALRPHICPSPEPISDLAALFERTFVLCAGAGTNRDNCMRHRQNASYWPRGLPVDVFEGPRLDAQMIRQHGASVAWMLGHSRADPTLAVSGVASPFQKTASPLPFQSRIM